MNKKRTQTGAALVVSMIMLVVLTLLVVSSIRSSTTNLRITGNMQIQGETTAAAQQAIEQVLSTDYNTTPAAQTITVPMGSATYTVNVSPPVCGNTSEVPRESLDINAHPEDAYCLGDSDVSSVTHMDGAQERQIGQQALCNQDLWEIQADVADTNSGAKTTIVQGVLIRAGRDSGC
ncbi:pilus assembly PilX N-terminal domain-containing protein [Herbaspirillum sp. ST 5-3]|uniref:pilus assembly PilX N-terminal domain-containing protein n=1 Tax=Herbaspirillum sp. ST 5-3 TaxID=2567936 RepID=UPI0010A36B5E|nr:pilus assembly PilX N-terminal domain-containing protein [Herbaspirillum sp. ST 5-3]